MPRPKTHAAAPAMPTGPEDAHHPPADPAPPPQSPPRAAVGVRVHQSGDAGRVGSGLSREEQLSVAQADANMAALLQEEAGSAHLAAACAFLHGHLCHITDCGSCCFLALLPGVLCCITKCGCRCFIALLPGVLCCITKRGCCCVLAVLHGALCCITNSGCRCFLAAWCVVLLH